MKRFRFHWLDGKTEEAKGKSVSDAFTSLGYGASAINALDFWEEIA